LPLKHRPELRRDAVDSLDISLDIVRHSTHGDFEISIQSRFKGGELSLIKADSEMKTESTSHKDEKIEIELVYEVVRS
jgi:hypothetical protein